MRILFLIVAILAILFFSAPAWASLPYYNQEIGYTIWLPRSWRVVDADDLDTSRRFSSALPVHAMVPNWQAGYTTPAGGPVLLVEALPGRKMVPTEIANFNRYVVRSLQKSGGKAARIKAATYFRDKKTLRVESEIQVDGQALLNVSYLIYTRKGMLSFVGVIQPGDDTARTAIDKAVLSLYLDDDIRYDVR